VLVVLEATPQGVEVVEEERVVELHKPVEQEETAL
jgi:hypothetical protein